MKRSITFNLNHKIKKKIITLKKHKKLTNQKREKYFYVTLWSQDQEVRRW